MSERHQFEPADFGGDTCMTCGEDIRNGQHFVHRTGERRKEDQRKRPEGRWPERRGQRHDRRQADRRKG